MLKAFQTDVTIEKTLYETIYENDDVVGIEAFCLDLCDTVGMVWKVKKGFVGTIDITMGNKALSETYTADAPAREDESLILNEIAAYELRTDIKVCVTDAEGNISTCTFNLCAHSI